MVVFKRPNSPNWYCRYYVQQEQKYYQKSLKTSNRVIANDKAKEIYRQITTLINRDEKVFGIKWIDALDGYAEMERARLANGVISESWYTKKITYLRNKWIGFVGEDTIVNKTTDDDAKAYVKHRMASVARKDTLRQELTSINAFYKDYLIPNGYCLRPLRFGKLIIRKADRARRVDTFTVDEWEILYKSMRQWVEWDEIPHVRIAATKYGKKDSPHKELNENQRQLEWCRRQVLREFILINANLGTRPASELLQLKRKDVEITKTLFKDWYADGNDEWKLTCDISVDSLKTGHRMVNGIAGRYFQRLFDFYESQGVTLKPDDYVFIDLHGRRKGMQIDRFVLNRLFAELMQYCKLTRLKFEPYHLRHWYITQRLMNGVDIVLISENVGNSPKVIWDTYSHIRTKLATQELNKQRRRKSFEELGVEF